MRDGQEDMVKMQGALLPRSHPLCQVKSLKRASGFVLYIPVDHPPPPTSKMRPVFACGCSPPPPLTLPPSVPCCRPPRCPAATPALGRSHAPSALSLMQVMVKMEEGIVQIGGTARSPSMQPAGVLSRRF